MTHHPNYSDFITVSSNFSQNRQCFIQRGAWAFSPSRKMVSPPPRDRFRIPGRKNLDKTLKTVNMIVSNNIEICIPFVENISI
jgi:hypothetical protein